MKTISAQVVWLILEAYRNWAYYFAKICGGYCHCTKHV